MFQKHIADNSFMVIKRIWIWVSRHQTLIILSCFVLLTSYFGIYLLKKRLRENLIRSAEKYQQEQSQITRKPTRVPVSFAARQADAKLTALVKKSIEILDSNAGGIGYQINVFVDSTASFTPVGIQFIAADTYVSITNATLTVQKPRSCWDDARRRKTNYETEWISESWIQQYAPYGITRDRGIRRHVNLFVKVNNDLFRIENLEVTGECLWSIN